MRLEGSPDGGLSGCPGHQARPSWRDFTELLRVRFRPVARDPGPCEFEGARVSFGFLGPWRRGRVALERLHRRRLEQTRESGVAMRNDRKRRC